jgi:hypothetical protein
MLSDRGAPTHDAKDEVMAKAASTVELEAPADQVWERVGGFGSLSDWLPFFTKTELTEGGRIRRLHTSDGEVIVERLMAFDERTRRYAYHILQGPFPVSDYYAALVVTEIDGGRRTRVTWSGEFIPNAGVSDAEASAIFQEIYDDGLNTLAQSFPS